MTSTLVCGCCLRVQQLPQSRNPGRGVKPMLSYALNRVLLAMRSAPSAPFLSTSSRYASSDRTSLYLRDTHQNLCRRTACGTVCTFECPILSSIDERQACASLAFSMFMHRGMELAAQMDRHREGVTVIQRTCVSHWGQRSLSFYVTDHAPLLDGSQVLHDCLGQGRLELSPTHLRAVSSRLLLRLAGAEHIDGHQIHGLRAVCEHRRRDVMSAHVMRSGEKQCWGYRGRLLLSQELER